MKSNLCRREQKIQKSVLLPLLYQILNQTIRTISSRSPITPFQYFSQQFNQVSLTYKLQPLEKLVLNTTSLAKFVRLLELIKIVIQNLQEGKTITKRNLFYKLQSYYYSYSTLDEDLRLICYNLWQIYTNIHILDQNKPSFICKNDLGIIASNRCIIFGKIQLIVDGKNVHLAQKDQNNSQVITIPTCRTIHCKSLKAAKVLLIQKESIFYNLVTLFKTLNLDQNYILITAKGYPDHNTRIILSQLAKQKNPQIETIYYLGDYDVYGFDIFMFYAFGDWLCQGVLQKIQILQLGKQINKDNNLFSLNYLKINKQMNRFSKEDDKKVKQIREKINKILSKKNLFNKSILQKIQQISLYFEAFVKQQRKCQLQLLFECANNNIWLYEMIKNKQKEILKL